MIRVRFIASDGISHAVEAAPGDTLMQAARDHDISGIVATCGGACACATCHVYVDSGWLDQLPPASEDERDMLQFANGIQDNSRLSCQIELTAAMDGLTVHVPESQD